MKQRCMDTVANVAFLVQKGHFEVEEPNNASELLYLAHGRGKAIMFKLQNSSVTIWRQTGGCVSKSKTDLIDDGIRGLQLGQASSPDGPGPGRAERRLSGQEQGFHASCWPQGWGTPILCQPKRDASTGGCNSNSCCAVETRREGEARIPKVATWGHRAAPRRGRPARTRPCPPWQEAAQAEP